MTTEPTPSKTPGIHPSIAADWLRVLDAVRNVGGDCAAVAFVR